MSCVEPGRKGQVAEEHELGDLDIAGGQLSGPGGVRGQHPAGELPAGVGALRGVGAGWLRVGDRGAVAVPEIADRGLS